MQHNRHVYRFLLIFTVSAIIHIHASRQHKSMAPLMLLRQPSKPLAGLRKHLGATLHNPIDACIPPSLVNAIQLGCCHCKQTLLGHVTLH